MMGKLLQWLGALSVLGLIGASVFALTVVKDRIRVVIQLDAAATGPDPVALLKDDLQVLTREQAELRVVLASNFEQLGAALEERAVARHADVQALAGEVAALRRRADATHAELGRAQERLQDLDARLRTSGPATAHAEGAPTTAPVPEPVVAPVEPVEPVEPATVATPPVAAVAPEPAKPKAGGFLSFSVPAATFRFDAQQDYVLAPDLCRVGFDAKSTLHDFSGATAKVTGRFTADFDDPAGGWTGEIVCDAGTLLTGVDGRDANMWEHLDTKNHPQIRFVIARFVPAAGGIDVGKQTARGEVQGTMSIRGVERQLRMPVGIEVDASKRVVVTGQVPLKLSDYGVPVPSQLGVINMQDEVVVWIALRARVQSGGSK